MFAAVCKCTRACVCVLCVCGLFVCTRAVGIVIERKVAKLGKDQEEFTVARKEITIYEGIRSGYADRSIEPNTLMVFRATPSRPRSTRRLVVLDLSVN